MLAQRRVERLNNVVPRRPAHFVFGGLREIRVEVDRVAVGPAAGQFEEGHEASARVLRAQHSGAVGRQLRLAIPLQQGELEGQQRDRGQQRQCAHPEKEHDERDRAVGGAPRHDMAELLRQHEALLLGLQQFEHAGVDDDERLVEADGPRRGNRVLRHVELRDRLAGVGPVEGLQHVMVERMQHRPLRRPDQHGVAEKEIANARFAEDAGDLAHHVVTSGEGAERLQGGAVGRMFPGDRRDLRERRGGHNQGAGDTLPTAGGCSSSTVEQIRIRSLRARRRDRRSGPQHLRYRRRVGPCRRSSPWPS